MTAKVIRFLPKAVRDQMALVRRSRALLDKTRRLHGENTRFLRKLCKKHGVAFERLEL